VHHVACNIVTLLRVLGMYACYSCLLQFRAYDTGLTTWVQKCPCQCCGRITLGHLWLCLVYRHKVRRMSQLQQLPKFDKIFHQPCLISCNSIVKFSVSIDDLSHRLTPYSELLLPVTVRDSIFQPVACPRRANCRAEAGSLVADFCARVCNVVLELDHQP